MSWGIFREKLMLLTISIAAAGFLLWIISDVSFAEEGVPPIGQNYVDELKIVGNKPGTATDLAFGSLFLDRCAQEKTNAACSDSCPETAPAVLGEAASVEKPIAEIVEPVAPVVKNDPPVKVALKKEAAKPPTAKQVATQAAPVHAPGVKFTNDRSRVSCRNPGGDHAASKDKKKNHYDEDCCIDKDEWLQPGCTYHYNDIKYSLNGKKPLPVWKPKN